VAGRLKDETFAGFVKAQRKPTKTSIALSLGERNPIFPSKIRSGPTFFLFRSAGKKLTVF